MTVSEKLFDNITLDASYFKELENLLNTGDLRALHEAEKLGTDLTGEGDESGGKIG